MTEGATDEGAQELAEFAAINIQWFREWANDAARGCESALRKTETP